MKEKDREIIEEIGRYNSGRSSLKGKCAKCLSCGEILGDWYQQCPECGSYDLEDIWLSAQELAEYEERQ